MKWEPCVKRFLIACAVAAVLIALACIFLWEQDAVYYIIFGILTAVAIYRAVVVRKLDGGL